MAYPDSDVVPQRLKVMHVLDCTPGFAGDPRGSTPEAGYEPITILTLSHRGEIEQPVMLDLRDTKLLLKSLRESLEHHGQSEEVEDVKSSQAPWPQRPESQPKKENPYSGEITFGRSQADQDAHPLGRSEPARGGLPPTGLKIRILHDGRTSEKEVFGVYHDRKFRLVLCRCHPADGGSPYDTVIKIDMKGRVILGSLGPDYYLPTSEWQRYWSLPNRAKFRIGKSTFWKMSVLQVRMFVESKVFAIK